jgi:glycosyltransferase involved in cell wall biosynthesis
MKIGITIGTPHVAGGTKCLLKVASGLRRRGHRVNVFFEAYSRLNYLRGRFFPQYIRWTEKSHRIHPLKSWSKLPLDYDVMVASSWRTAEPVAAWCQKTGRKGLYYVQHDESIWDGGEKAAQTYYLPLKKIAISTWLRDILKNTYQQESLLCVTPVDESLFENFSPHPNRSRRVLMLHHTFDWKGFEDGLSAIEKSREKHPDFQLVVLGGREENPELPEGTEYHFQPSREAMNHLYAGCGIFLCPSWHEGLGMPAMEAMATGALLVTTDTGGSRDYAFQGETALVSAPRHVEALAANLTLALSQWTSLEKMRQSGREIVRQWTWEKQLDSIETLMTQEAFAQAKGA